MFFFSKRRASAIANRRCPFGLNQDYLSASGNPTQSSKNVLPPWSINLLLACEQVPLWLVGPREKSSLVFSLRSFRPTPYFRSLITGLGSRRTGLTKFVWPFQKSRQNLSLPDFQFVKRGRTETAKYLLTTSVNHTEINAIACALFVGKVT